MTNEKVKHDSRKEERVRLAKEMSRIDNQIFNLGTWDQKKIDELKREKDRLNALRIATFQDKAEYEEHRENLKKGAKPRWSGCYTEMIAWGGSTLRQDYTYPNGQVETIYGWPEWYTEVEPEWMMRFDTEELEKANHSHTIADQVEKIKQAWGIK